MLEERGSGVPLGYGFRGQDDIGLDDAWALCVLDSSVDEMVKPIGSLRYMLLGELGDVGAVPVFQYRL